MRQQEIIKKVDQSFYEKKILPDYDWVFFSNDLLYLSIAQQLCQASNKTSLAIIPNELDLGGLFAIPENLANKLSVPKKIFQFLEQGKGRKIGFGSTAIEEVLYGASESYCLVDKFELTMKLFNFDHSVRSSRTKILNSHELLLDSGYGVIKMKNYKYLPINKEAWINFEMKGKFPEFFRDEIVWHDQGLIFVFTRVDKEIGDLRVKIIHWSQGYQRANWQHIVRDAFLKVYPWFSDFELSIKHYRLNDDFGIPLRFKDLCTSLSKNLGQKAPFEQQFSLPG